MGVITVRMHSDYAGAKTPQALQLDPAIYATRVAQAVAELKKLGGEAMIFALNAEPPFVRMMDDQGNSFNLDKQPYELRNLRLMVSVNGSCWLQWSVKGGIHVLMTDPFTPGGIQ